MKALARYPEAIEMAGALMEPHRVTYYLDDPGGGLSYLL
jgi:arginyl-tRNA synthetase